MLDRWVPLPALSLIAVLRRPGETSTAARVTENATPADPEPASRAWARMLVAWLAVLIVCAEGGRITANRVSQLRRSPGGRYATSDLFLAPLGPAPSAKLVAAFDMLAQGEELFYVGPIEDTDYWFTVASVSYLAWPRPFWVMLCEPGVSQPRFMIPTRRPGDVRHLLFYSRQPPAPLWPGRRIGDRLWLTSSRPDVPWTRYCWS